MLQRGQRRSNWSIRAFLVIFEVCAKNIASEKLRTERSSYVCGLRNSGRQRYCDAIVLVKGNAATTYLTTSRAEHAFYEAHATTEIHVSVGPRNRGRQQHCGAAVSVKEA